MSRPLRINSPADLIEIVPFLIGFAPTESAVIIGLNATRVLVTARVDLDAGEGTVLQTLDRLRANLADRFVMVVYTEQPAPQWVIQPNHTFQEALLVTGGRWYSLLCTDPACCPRDGRPLCTEPSTVSTTAVSLGLAPVNSRDDLAAALAPRSITAVAAERAAELSPIPARDLAWLELDRFIGDEDALRALAAYYLATARDCPQDHTSAAPWFLYAWAQWRLGDGARASIALDYLDAVAPGYRAADLLRGALHAAINPHRMPPLAQLGEQRDELGEAVAAALDEAHLPWTRDEDTYTVAGCSVALNYATGRPEVWQVEADADPQRVADALSGVEVSAREEQPGGAA